MRKIIAVFAFCAVMLTGCTREKQTEEILKNSITGSTFEVTEETTVTEVKTEETTIVTELATEAETTAEPEQKKEPFRVVYTGNSWRMFALGDGIFCVPSECLNFVNADTGEFIVSISIPDDFNSVDKVVRGSGGVLAKATFDDYDYSTTPPTYYANAIIVKDDYTYETIYDCEPADVSFEACGHNIAEWGIDIIDVDSGETILAGKSYDEYYLDMQTMYFKFELDDNRFVYRIGGYESLPGYGIYDFSTGTATTVPESRDLLPIGCHNGKIYSVKSAWDGWGTELYVTDIATLETEFFMDFPQELTVNQIVDYSMPESGEFIAANKVYYSDDNGVYSAALYRINPDTAKVEGVIEIPDEYKCYNQGYLIDESTFAVSYNKEDATILVDLKWTEIADDKAILDEFVETVREAYADCVENESFDKLDKIEELSSVFYYTTPSIGYCCLDIDGDGADELLFGGNGVIYNIYDVRDGKLHCTMEGGERHYFLYCGDGVIENQGSGAAWYSYHKFYSCSGGEPELIEAVIYDASRSEENPFFHMTAGQTEEEAVPISEEKALEIIEGYKAVDVEFTPFIGVVDDKAILDEFLETVRAVYVERVETGDYDKLDEIEEFLGDPFYFGEKDYQSMGYCYMDIDNNGTEELIFGAINPINGRTTIYNVATVRDGKIFQPVEGWTRNSFWYCGDGIIGNYGSGGAGYNEYNFYKYNDGELELIEAFNFDYDKTGEDYCFHMKAGQTEDDAVKISKEERDKIVEEYGRVKIDLTPFIDDIE